MDTLECRHHRLRQHLRHLSPEHPRPSAASSCAPARICGRRPRRPRRRATASRRCSVEALLARDDIDLVVNLTVPAAHFGVSLAALRAGKHVFSEKPLAIDFEQGRELVDEAEAAGCTSAARPTPSSAPAAASRASSSTRARIGRVLSGTAFLMSHGMEHWHPDPASSSSPAAGRSSTWRPTISSALVNLLGPVQRVLAHVEHRLRRAHRHRRSPRKGQRIAVETPTTRAWRCSSSPPAPR